MISNKKTRIVATIGPVTTSVEMLTKLLKTGLNVIRMNFSHGDFAEHQQKIDNGKIASEKTGIPVLFMQDLSGPKIRLGEFNTESGRVTIKKGQTFTITTDKIKGDETISSINYDKFPKEVKVGHRVMLDDGKKELIVTAIKGNKVTCKVVVGGELKGRRGVNLPDTDISLSSLTEKDKADLEFGLKNGVHYYALSFVRRAGDVIELRDILRKRKSTAQIISKIETPHAIQNIDEIIEVSDALMVARGDLAIEVPTAEVPLHQKMMIDKCNAAGKPVVTATQMLESMIHSPVPTRAEVSDVANAVFDGTDAVMLSEETTLGEYPLEAVETMARVAMTAENSDRHAAMFSDDAFYASDNLEEATAASVALFARSTGAKAIVVATDTGNVARFVSRHKLHVPILAFTSREDVYQQVIYSFACNPFKIADIKDTATIIATAKKEVVKEKVAKKGDTIVCITSANSIVVETV